MNSTVLRSLLYFSSGFTVLQIPESVVLSCSSLPFPSQFNIVVIIDVVVYCI